MLRPFGLPLLDRRAYGLSCSEGRLSSDGRPPVGVRLAIGVSALAAGRTVGFGVVDSVPYRPDVGVRTGVRPAFARVAVGVSPFDGVRFAGRVRRGGVRPTVVPRTSFGVRASAACLPVVGVRASAASLELVAGLRVGSGDGDGRKPVWPRPVGVVA